MKKRIVYATLLEAMAAPDLLGALRALVQEAEFREKNGEPWGFSIDAAKQAIAKAGGEDHE